MEKERKILIVDDEAEWVELIKKVLLINGFQTIVAGSAAEARQILSDDMADLVLLDIKLPDSDGIKFCKSLLSDKKFNNLPVIMLSAYSHIENRLKAYQAGAVDFLAKPVDTEELVLRANLHLELRNLRAESSLHQEQLNEMIDKLQSEKVSNLNLLEQQKNLLEEAERSRKALLSILEDEKALLQEKLMLTFTIDRSVNEVYIFDAESLKFIYVNQGALRNLGYSMEQLREMTPLDLKKRFNQKTFNELLEPLKNRREEVVRFETFHLRKDGSEYPVEVNLQLSDFEGKKVFLAVIQDITEKIAARQELEKSHILYRNLFENTGTATIIVREDGVITMANEECYRITGYSQQELIGTKWEKYVATESLPLMLDYFQKRFTARENIPKRYEARLIHASGEIRDAILTIGHAPELDFIIVSMLDITPLKNTEKALRESEEKYRALVENAMETISVVQDGKIRFSNPNLINITGYTIEELNNGDPLRIIHSDDRPMVTDYLKKRTAGLNIPENYQFRIIDKSGRIRWLDRKVTNIQWEGRPAFLVFDQDVTEKYIRETELKRSETQWRITFDAIQDGIILLDSDQKILKTNHAFDKMFGNNGGNGKCVYCYEKVHQTTCPIEGCPFVRMKKSLEREVMEMVINGNTYLITVDPILNENREFQGAVHVISDITQSKKIEATLRENQAQLNALLNYIPAMILIKDAELRPIYANEKFCHYFPFEEWKNRRPEETFPPEIASVMIAKDTEALEKGYCSYEETWKDKYGVEHVLFTQKFRIEVAEDEILLGGIIQDITEKVKAEKELEKYRKELEKLVEERTIQLENTIRELEAFTYSVSHDLKAPLRAINGFAKILLNEYAENLDNEGKHYCRIIAENALEMGHLIEDLLRLSRVGRTELQKEEVNNETLVKSILNEIMNEEQKSKYQVKIHKLSKVRGDYILLKQVWINLISNALKFSANVSDPVIEIGCAKKEGTCEFYVKDNGVGFDNRYTGNLFKVFQRLHNKREFEGTGVGLAIVKQIVSKHGGNVKAEGKPGKGAKFYFSLPLEG